MFKNYFVAENCSPAELTLKTFTLSNRVVVAAIAIVTLGYLKKKKKRKILRIIFSIPACLLNVWLSMQEMQALLGSKSLLPVHFNSQRLIESLLIFSSTSVPTVT